MSEKTAGVWLVDVAVPVPLRCLFSYAVPEDLPRHSIRVGHRVRVPFRAKTLHGVIMKAPYQSERPPRGLRPLIDYDPIQRILAPEIQRLLDWMVGYYKAPPGEALKLVLPPGLLNKQESIYTLTETGIALIKESDETDARLLSHLKKQPLNRRNWESAAQTEIPFTKVREWEESGLLQVSGIAEAESLPHVTVISITGLATEAALDELARAPKQQALLAWLIDRGDSRHPLKSIRAHFPDGTRAIGELERKGFIAKERIPEHELIEDVEGFQPDEIKQLTDEQDIALEQITHSLHSREYAPFLLFGITGSGKTEVYLRAIQTCLDQGRQALFLVPEISLTPLMRKRISSRFGERLAILHSAVGAGRRSTDWARVLAGKVDVVLGARSAVFAPLPRLGLVVVDEEHDLSYKQNDGIRYHARDVAMVRAKMAKAAIVLGSATPSLESWQNTRIQRIHLLQLTKRATNALLPKVEVIDMREEFKVQRRRPILSRALLGHMTRELEKGRQVMILLNRRGFHSFLLCRKCGETAMCNQCEVSLTFHKTENRLKCHYCNEVFPIPQTCTSCGSPAAMMQFFGEGTQQIQEVIQAKFPDHVTDRIDRDRLTNQNAHENILSRFESGETRILVGTQMIAKGHDFPNVTLVGIINADQGLRVPDFRSAEITFQLLTQVAGRSGRGQNPGAVVIQTYMPEHYSIRYAAQHDFPGFLQRELTYRESLFYAPFAYLVSLLIQDRNDETARQTAQWMAEQLQHHRGKAGAMVLGPTKAPIAKIKHAHRYQIILKGANRKLIHDLADVVVEEAVKRKYIARQGIILDIDPYHFL